MVFMQATQLESEIQNATYCCETLILVTFAKHCQKRHPLALSANSPSHRTIKFNTYSVSTKSKH